MRNKIIALLVILAIFIMPTTASSVLTATPANTQLSINGQAVQGVYINDKLYLPARNTFEKASWIVDYKPGQTDIYTPEYKLSPYCVLIKTNLGTGSGVLVNGKILTAYHVVQGASDITVYDYQRYTHSTKVIKYDASLDVALLSTNMSGGVEIGESNIEKNARVDLITCPKGVLNVYERGIYYYMDSSGKYLTLRTNNVYPGSSGGGVFYNNKLIGIIDNGGAENYSSQAIPINDIKRFLN